MTACRLHLLHAGLVSRERAAEAWAEADRIETLALHEGVVDALKGVGWLVDVDDSDAESGVVRWLLWARDVDEAVAIVRGTPLGHLDLLKPKTLYLDDAPSTLEWVERVREERGADPDPPAPRNLFERLLDRAPAGKLMESLDDPDRGEAERILVSWAMCSALDRAAKEGHGRASVDSVRAMLSDSLRRKILGLVRGVQCGRDAWARLEDIERRMADLRAILGEYGIDPDAITP